MTFSVPDATLIAVSGLLVKEIAAYFMKRRANGKDKQMYEDVKDIKFKVEDIPLIKNTMKNYEVRCEAHMRIQDGINSQVGGKIKELDDRLYEHCTKD